MKTSDADFLVLPYASFLINKKQGPIGICSFVWRHHDVTWISWWRHTL